jgi:ATP-dependent helicase HrpA
VTLNQLPAEPETIHRAALAGLLSHVGLRDAARREYAGARGARFALFPGSSLARRPPTWVMSAELVETSRLWGRTNAKVEPRWIEPLAEHLLKRTYEAPRWDRRRAGAVATERATLYGLPVVAGRTVTYGRIDPVLSRELFIRRALVEGDWDTRHAFLAANRQTAEAVAALEDRARRRGLLIDDQQLYELYASRIPETVISGRHFDRWYKNARRRDPAILTFSERELTTAAAQDAVDAEGRPTQWKQGELILPLTYRFEPGAPDDGVTVHVPLAELARLKPRGFDWLVPALRDELVTALIRGLPKELRKRLVPVPDVARQVLERVTPRSEPIAGALTRELEATRGVRIDPAEVEASAEKLPPHLRMRFSVEEEDGTVVAQGHDLAALREAVKPRLRAQLAAATAGLERTGLRDWPGGTIPREVERPGLRAFPALTDEGGSVGLRIFESRTAQAAAMHAGTRRLLELTIPSPVKPVQGRLSNATQLSLAAAPHPGGARQVLEDAVRAALEALVAEAGGPAWSESAWRRLRTHVAGRLVATTLTILERTARILEAAQAVRRRLAELPGDRFAPVRSDVASQLGRLVFPGFVAATGAGRLEDVERYLHGAAQRLERLPDVVASDLDRMGAVHELEAAYRARRHELSAGGAAAVPPGLRDVPWLLEELRLGQFAPGVAVRGPVSAKRIRRVLANG